MNHQKLFTEMTLSWDEQPACPPPLSLLGWPTRLCRWASPCLRSWYTSKLLPRLTACWRAAGGKSASRGWHGAAGGFVRLESEHPLSDAEAAARATRRLQAMGERGTEVRRGSHMSGLTRAMSDLGEEAAVVEAQRVQDLRAWHQWMRKNPLHSLPERMSNFVSEHLGEAPRAPPTPPPHSPAQPPRRFMPDPHRPALRRSSSVRTPSRSTRT